MGFDIRLPIGMLFSLFGLLLTGYGVATRGSTIYVQHSLGLNINLRWGLVLLCFGLTMLLLTRFRAVHKSTDPDQERREGPKASASH